jgi:hypothetical protein
MTDFSEAPLDRLWKEYSAVFQDFDDLTLARWMAQTLGQIQGRIWRLSHPLLGAYRLAAQLGHDRQIWFKRLVTIPSAYVEAPCCGAPLLPLLTRDVADTGLVCQHCGETCVTWDDIPPNLLAGIRAWADQYRPVHAVAHWDDAERKSRGKYEVHLEQAAKEAEKLLAQAGTKLVPLFLDHFSAVVWEDQDECLEVRPEDIEL